MDYQVLAIRTRPQSFDQVVGQQPVVAALTHALNQNKLHHAYLFTGTRGVGKTTIARIIAKAMNCEQGVSANPCNQCNNCRAITEGKFADLIEIDAASKTKVEDTRSLLDTVIYSPTQGRYKIYLIDEVHMLSTHSFNALLKTLEEPPAHVKFLLATTDPQKLPATIVSRCLQFTLKWVEHDIMVSHLENVLSKDGVNFEHDAITILAEAANGSIRDALSLLEQAVAHGAGELKADQVRSMLGTIANSEITALLTRVVDNDASAIVQKISDLSISGVDFSQVLTQLIYALHNMIIIQQAPDVASIKSIDFKQELEYLAQKITPENVQVFYQMALLAKRDLPYSPQPKLALEMALLRMQGFRAIPAQTSSYDANNGVSQGVVSRSGVVPVTQKTENKHNGNLAQNSSSVQKKQPLAPGLEQPVVMNKTIVPETKPIVENQNNNNGLPTNDNWGSWINTLGVNGILLQIIKNTEFKNYDGKNIVLKLDNRAKPLVNQKRIDDLESRLKQVLNTEVKLMLEYADAASRTGHHISMQANASQVAAEVKTPAKLEQQQKKEKKEQLVAKLKNDPNINSIMKTFNGELQLDSVELLDEPIE